MKEVNVQEYRRTKIAESKHEVKKLTAPSLLKTLCMSMIASNHAVDVSNYWSWRSYSRSGSFYVKAWMDPADWGKEEHDLTYIMSDENTLINTAFNIQKHGGHPYHSVKEAWVILPV